MKKLYKIGEFAEKMGVSVGFLKHHEKFGLISPITTESGHRFYTEDHAIQVCRCMSLQSMGFSIKETAALLSDNSDIDIKKLAETQCKKKERELKRLEQSICFLKSIISHNREFGTRNTWNIKSNVEYYYLEFSSAGAFVDREGAPSTSNWMEYFPISVLAHRFEIVNGKPVLCGTGFAIPIDSTLAETSMDLSRAEIISFPKALEYLMFKNMNGLGWGTQEYTDRLLEEPLSVCEKHNFTPSGKVMVISVFSSELAKNNPIDAVCFVELERD